jgi:hypothetical protein
LDEQERHNDNAIASTCRLIVRRDDRFVLTNGFFVGRNEILTCNDLYLVEAISSSYNAEWYVVPHGFSVGRECLVRKFQCQRIRTVSDRYFGDIFILRTDYESNDWLEISFGEVQSPLIPTITYYEKVGPANLKYLPIEKLERVYKGTRATLLQLPRQPSMPRRRGRLWTGRPETPLDLGHCGGPLILNGKAVGE